MTAVTAYWDRRFTAHEPPAGEAEVEWTGRLAVERGPDVIPYALDRLVEPVIEQYDPGLLLVSAAGDPLGRNVVRKAGFEALGARACALADRVAGGRLAFVQEGGYHPSHLAYATLGTLEGALGVDSEDPDPFAWLDGDPDSARRRTTTVTEHDSSWWRFE